MPAPLIARSRPTARAAGLIALVTALATSAGAAAATPTPGACRVQDLDSGITRSTLQRAVDDASPGADLALRGTCRGLTIITKDLAITGIETPVSGRPVLDGALSGTVVTVASGVRVTLRDLSIRFGATPGAGGGVVNAGDLLLRDVVVRANSARDGGGIANVGTLRLAGATSVRDNRAERYGGGVLNNGTLVLLGTSSISGNSAYAGGGVRNEGPEGGGRGALILRDGSTIRGNTADRYGGVDNDYLGTIRLEDASRVSANTGGSCGGIYNYRGTITMEDASRVSANTGGWCGGISLSQGSLQGVRCAPDPQANVVRNDPVDCCLPG